MSIDLRVLDSPEKIADAGELIYAERYQAQLEPDRRGHFIAVDVTSGEGYVAEYPEQALQDARAAAPNGIFHLIRIGAPGAFDVNAVFAGILVLTAFALLLDFAVTLAERRLLRWRPAGPATVARRAASLSARDS